MWIQLSYVNSPKVTYLYSYMCRLLVISYSFSLIHFGKHYCNQLYVWICVDKIPEKAMTRVQHYFYTITIALRLPTRHIDPGINLALVQHIFVFQLRMLVPVLQHFTEITWEIEESLVCSFFWGSQCCLLVLVVNQLKI